MKERGHIESRVKPDRLVVEIRESKAKGGREKVRSRGLLNTGGVKLGEVMWYKVTCATAVTAVAL